MIATILVLMVAGSIHCEPTDSIDASANPPHRVKRIAYGRDLYSNTYFDTQYFVEIRHNFECILDHHEHKYLLTHCQGFHACGSSLIHPQFVMSAAHCIMYFELILYPIEFEVWWESFLDVWDDVVRAVKSVFIVTKPKHTMYSDWSLLAGGTNYYTMTQQRHAFHVFPHPDWVESEKDPRYADLAHDFVLIQTCEPFDITKSVRLAYLQVKTKMEEHYERVVKLGLVCLYIGMGDMDQYDYIKYSRYPWIAPYSNWTQYTWLSSMCYAECSFITTQYKEKLRKHEHSCHLCGYPVGPQIVDTLPGDSGSPVICDNKIVSVVSAGDWKPEYNKTWSSSYAVHCARNMITKERLEYYLRVNHDEKPYHSLGEASRKLRRIADVRN